MSFGANFAGGDSVIANMGQIQQLINNALQDLDQNAQASLSVWDSDAKEQYKECKRIWDARAAEMPAKLQIASTILQRIFDDIRRTEAQNTARWASS